MKKLIYMGALALIAAGGIFWSCQKDEFIIPEEGMTLKSSSICCVNDWAETEVGPVYFRKTKNVPGGGFATNDLTAYVSISNNSEYTTLIFHGGNEVFDGVKINGTDYSNDTKDDYLEIQLAVTEYCKEVNYSMQLFGVGNSIGKTDLLAVNFTPKDLCETECTESFSYVNNGGGSYTFTYIPDADYTDANLVFTFAQGLTISGDLSSWASNGVTKQKTMSLTACNTYEWTVTLDCATMPGAQNLWTDFKVNDESKKGTLYNIKCN